MASRPTVQERIKHVQFEQEQKRKAVRALIGDGVFLRLVEVFNGTVIESSVRLTDATTKAADSDG